MPELLTRCELVSKLAPFVTASDRIDSKMLLRAYASFQAEAEGTLPGHAGYLLLLDSASAFYPEASEAFGRFSLSEFLMFIVPDLTCDAVQALRLLLRVNPQPASIVTRCCFVLLIHAISEKIERTPHKRSEHLALCWEIYQREAKLPLISQRMFEQLFLAICFYPLNPKSFDLKSLTKRKAEAAIRTLQLLGETDEQILIYAYRIFTEKRISAANLAALFSPKPEEHPLGESEYLGQFEHAVKDLMNAEPIDVLSGITLLKPTNDITLENDYVYRTFAGSLNPERSKNHVTVVGANPFFIRSWLQDPTLRGIRVDFIDFRESYIDLLEVAFQRAPENVSFLSAAKWIRRVQDGEQPEDTAALMFAVALTNAQQHDWLNAWRMLRFQNSAELFLLSASNAFEQQTSPVASLWAENQLEIQSITLMPQNIPSSTAPHRKLFLRCTFSASDESQSIPVCALSLLSHGNNLYMMRKPTVYVSASELRSAKTLRKFYLSALLAHDDTLSRQEGFPYQFSPELTFWFSQSWPKNNADRPRLEAYVCQPADTKKIERGLMPRGKRIQETIKRKTAVRPEDIDDWLEYRYPFATISSRRSSHHVYDVRSAVIACYGAQLASQEISLKTLWYLYPEMEAQVFSDERDYQIFEGMMHTPIGDLKPSALDEQMLLELFQINPEFSESGINEELRLFLLSQAVDFAIEHDHCSENRLQQQILERQKTGRNLFSEIRAALVKKNFSMAQLRTILRTIIKDLEQSHFEYLGVLIRLFLGLECNIICALRFGDVEYVEDYDFCKLLIYRQLSNDGKTESGFKKTEDYRCVPLPAVITHYIRKRKEHLLLRYPELSEASLSAMPLVQAGEADVAASMAPKQLGIICKEVLREAAIPDEFIYVPIDDGGVKETNLAHYGGDLFRANFQYYALSTARFSQDELRYLLGNTPATTFGRYYCDFLNDAVQFILYRKLMRLEAAFHDPAFVCCPVTASHGSNALQSASAFESPVCLAGTLHLTSGDEPVTLKLKSRFGMDMTAGYLTGGDES